MFPTLRPQVVDREADLVRLRRALSEKPRTPRQLPSQQHKTIVVAQDKSMKCPECGSPFPVNDVVPFKMHVFSCRSTNQTNPMLPLLLLRRRSPIEFPRATKEKSRDVLRPLSEPFERIQLFSGHEAPKSATARTPGRRAQSSSHEAALAYGGDATSSSVGARGTKRSVKKLLQPAWLDERAVRAVVARPEKTNVEDANVGKVRAGIQDFIEDVELGGSSENGLRCLNLRGISFGSSDIPVLSSVLGQGSLLNVQQLDISDSVVQHDIALRFMKTLLKSCSLEVLVAEGCNIETSFHRSVSPNTRTSVMDHLAKNRQRGEHDRAAKQFEQMVSEHQKRISTQQANHHALFAAVRERRQEIRTEERSCRAELSQELRHGLEKLRIAERRREIYRIKLVHRQALVDEEAQVRNQFFLERISDLLDFVVKEEIDQRKVVIQRRETNRLQDRLVEREAVVQAKQQERNRIQANRRACRCVEDEETAARDALVAAFDGGHNILRKQSQRHQAYITWVLQQREDVEGRVRYESVVREGIEKEEDGLRNSLTEKLRRTIEGVKTKYLAQQEALVALELRRRKEESAAFSDWFSMSQKLFHTESRLVRLWERTSIRESKRLALLQELPILSSGAQEPRMYCMPPVGQRPTPPIPLLTTTEFTLRMSDGWTESLHELEEQCKTAVVEEKNAMNDHMRWVIRYAKRVNEASTIIHAPFEAIDLSDIAAITKRESSKPDPASGDAPMEPVQPETPSRAGGRRRVSVVPQMLDEELQLYRNRALRWCTAWYDKQSVARIMAAKVEVRGGVAECRISEDPSPPKMLGHGGHRLLARGCSTLEVLYDNGEADAEASAPALQRKVSWVDEFYMSFEESGRFDGRRKSSSGSDIIPAASGVGSDTDEEDEDEASAKQKEDEEEEQPEKSACTVIALNIGDPDSDAVPFDAISSNFQKIFYQNVAEVSPDTLIQPRSQELVVTLSLCVSVQDSYGEERSPITPDMTGWEGAFVEQNRTLYAVKLEQAFRVVTLPSLFRLPGGVAFPNVLLIEGQMTDVPLFPPIETIAEPYKVQWKTIDGREELVVDQESPPENPQDLSYTNGKLTVEILRPTTKWDRISLRDEAPTVRCETLERSTFVKSAAVHREQVLEVVAGAIQASRMVTPKNGSDSRAYCEMVLKNPANKVITGGALLEILNRLRFNNFQTEPEEGERYVRLTLETGDGRLSSVLEMRYEMEPIDKPTELKIVHPKVTFRQLFLSLPAQLKQHLLPPLVPVAPECLVIDEDTDRFSGGFLKVTLTSFQKGDNLVLVPDTGRLYPGEGVLERPNLIQIGGDGASIVFEERIVARVLKGKVFQSDGAAGGEQSEQPVDQPAGESDVEGSEAIPEIFMEFAQEDDCSIAAVQILLRHIALRPGPLPLKQHLAAQRSVNFLIQVMDNEQACQMEDVVTIRGGGHVVQLPEKSCTVDYKEGSGAIKLGNFDISTDRINPITNFSTGYIAVTIAEGFDNDSLSLKVDENEYKLVEVGEKPSRIARIPSKFLTPEVTQQGLAPNPPSLPKAPSMRGSSLGGSMRLTVKDRLKVAAAEAGRSSLPKGKDEPGSRRTSRANFSAVVVETVRQTKRLDIVFSGMREPIAQVTRVGNGKSMYIRFFKEKKENFVTKRQVIALLRNITYMCCSASPDETKKLVKVWVADSASATPSQCLLSLNVEVVDDVTEIMLKSPKKRCCQHGDPPQFPLFPSGRAKFADEDTDFFDGGTLTVSAVGGATRGDVLGLRLPAEQSLTRPSVPGYGVVFPLSDIAVRDGGKTVWLGEDQVATVEIATHSGGHSDLSVVFLAASPGSEKVTIDVATTILNSVCFGNTLDRVKEPTRTYMVKIRDADNPVEGKAKVTVEIQPPHFVAAPCYPYGSAPTFEAQFATDTFLPANQPDSSTPVPPVQLCPTITVNLERFSAGSLGLRLRDEGPASYSSADELLINWNEAGLTLKDTNLLCAKEIVAQNVIVSTSSLTMDFAASCKMTKQILQNLLRRVYLLPDKQRATEAPPEQPNRGGQTPSPRTPEVPSLFIAKTALYAKWVLSDGNSSVELETRIVYL